MQNFEIREAAMRAGVRHWEIARKMGVPEATFSRYLRLELPEAEREKVLRIIKTIQEERSAE